MKKWLLVLGMVACLFGMTACGAKNAEQDSTALGITEQDAINYADQLVDSINNVVTSGMQSQYASDAVISGALASWESAAVDMGEFQSVAGHDVVIKDDGATIKVAVVGSLHEAEVEVILDQDLQLTSITTNVKYSMGELMENAALNTIIGMGTVFVVLILICLLIYCFAFIPGIQASFEKKSAARKARKVAKKAAKAGTTPVPVQAVNVPAAPVKQELPAAEPEEELAEDCELVAVIAAAIAASQGAVTTDGFVVRSIRRRGVSNWKNN